MTREEKVFGEWAKNRSLFFIRTIRLLCSLIVCIDCEWNLNECPNQGCMRKALWIRNNDNDDEQTKIETSERPTTIENEMRVESNLIKFRPHKLLLLLTMCLCLHWNPQTINKLSPFLSLDELSCEPSEWKLAVLFQKLHYFHISLSIKH